MTDTDFIIISQADVVDYEAYSRLPVERIALFRDLVYPRMLYFRGGFRSHLDVLNYARRGSFFCEAGYPERREMLNIWNLPGLSGMHLAAYLLHYGIKTKVINNLSSEWDSFAAAYEACARPPLVGLSSTFHLSFASVQKLCKQLRSAYPGIEIVTGGAFINERATNGGPAQLERPMRKCGIDYSLFAFNSEPDLRDLLTARKTGAPLAGVNNLAAFNGGAASGSFFLTGEQWNPPVLDEMPPLWDKIAPDTVHRTVQLRTSSGCMFACAFCSYPVVARGFHAMGVEAIAGNLEAALRIPGVDRIIFVDDTFNVPVQRFREMCALFKKHNFEWFCFLRAQFVDEELAGLMRDSGCRGVYLGIESASDVILKNMNKKSTARQYREGVGFLKKSGITTIGAFIIGFPGETAGTVEEDIRFIEETGLDFYTLKEYYFMEHTPAYRDRARYGLSGAPAGWKHDTMDYAGAHAKKAEIFSRVKNSVFMDPDTNLWQLAYLYDQGFTFAEIAEMQRCLNRLMEKQMAGAFNDKDEDFGRIEAIVKGAAYGRKGK
ncbi:MAG TPA: hypothetical protein DCS63_10175 [Elusimicrobia bacterium]|nr:hypothetical protein [Elusimicrobiota bacterium]